MTKEIETGKTVGGHKGEETQAPVPAMPNVKPGRYLHFKGGIYEVLGCAIRAEECDGLDVIYRRAGIEQLFTRSYQDFNAEVTEPGGGKVRRFRRISD